MAASEKMMAKSFINPIVPDFQRRNSSAPTASAPMVWGRRKKLSAMDEHHENGKKVEDLHPHKLGEGAKGDGGDAMHLENQLYCDAGVGQELIEPLVY